MKKRIFMLALVTGLLLSLSASAWAATTFNKFTITDFDVPDTVYDAKIGNTVTVEFDIIVDAYPSGSSTGYAYANLLKWTVGGASWGTPSESFKITGVTATNSGDPDTSTSDSSDYLFKVHTIDQTSQLTVPYTLHIAVTGEVLKAGGDLTVVASLYQIGSGTAEVTADNRSTATTQATTSKSNTITTSEEWGYSTDPANPDASDEVWDGLNPAFTSDPGDNSVAKGKAKLTTTKFDKAFTSGTADTRTITITGPVTSIDVYVAAKDAIKLGWLAKGATTNIQLTKDNIKEYNIPFRITSYDFSKNENVLTGADKKEDRTGAAKDKDNAKKMTSTLTLAFNGGYFSYKGFPLTIAVTNDEMKKPAAKAIKIDVTPNTNTPVWWFWDTRTVTETKAIDVTEAVDTETNTIKLSAYTEDYTNPKLWGKEGTTLKLGADKDTYTVTAPTEGNAVVMLSYDVSSKENYKHVIDPRNNKADKNLEVPVSLVAGDDQGVVTSDMYYISGDYGPFTITAKGAKNGVTVVSAEPTFNYRGEMNKDNSGNEVDGGYVSFSGELEKKNKESKTAVTLTVTNPSTKKKAAAKINIVGKLPASFDVKKYPMSADLGMKVLATKYVEAGKIPSVKVKATGTKTITYSAEGSNEGGQELADVGLSFDAAKGAVVSLVKGKKETTPTVYYEDDYTPVFDPIPLTITAGNGVGEDSVRANVGITGAKPKLTTKAVTFSKTEHVVGAYKELAANAGKSAPAYNDYTANIEVSLADDTDKTLSDMGLKLATWKDLPNYVSNDGALIADGAEILNSGDTTVFTLYYTTTDDDGNETKTVLPAKTYTKVDKTTGKTLADFTTKTLPEGATAGESGNVYLSKGVHDDGEGYLAGRNKAYIMVDDVEAMNKAGAVRKQKVNLIVSNIGATNKASVTITIDALPTETETTSALPGSNKAASEAAKKTNGTAGLTYNGALPEGAEAEAEADADKSEKLTIGAARTAANLSAGQKAFLAEKGYKVVAVLPEITAEEAGQYDLDVELDEEAPEGAALIWIAFPKNAPAAEDDEIVDFYDEAGTPVEGVPASHKIIASPWLREAVTYEPVIAVEAE